MNKVLVHLLYLMLVMLPLGNHAFAMDDDDLMSLEDDLMADDDLLGSDDDLLGSNKESEDFEITLGFGGSKSSDEVFPVAYEHIDDMKVYDPSQYRARRGDFGYYTSGVSKKDNFRVNQNNEESTDETIGILFFIVALPAQLYVNFYGWWQ